MSKRVAVYVRVSTTRQATNDVSIPDQIAHAQRYCKGRCWNIEQEYIEAGASARDDKRPELQRMIDMACNDPSPYDVVLVHSQSRFFRDAVSYGLYKRKLEKHGVLLVSITQDFGEGPSAEFAETVIAAADALSSAENAKHTSRSMIENARQGFWNGQVPPFGYCVVEAERRGQKSKKKLAINESEAAIVVQIFKLCLQGDGNRGPSGLKEIVNWLYDNRLRIRGRQFYVSTVERIIKRETYTGLHHYNRMNTRSGKPRPEEEWVPMMVPSIITKEEFDRAQALLHLRRPSVTAPRVTASEVLLGGLGRCEGCGSPLTLGTGKGGRYRYYVCSSRKLKGMNVCPAPSRIPEGQLDDMVLTSLTTVLLTPDRLKSLLEAAQKHNRERKAKSSHTRTALNRELKSISEQKARLMTAVAEGHIPDMTLVRPKLEELQGRRIQASRQLALLDDGLPELRRAFSNQQASFTAATLQERLQRAPKAVQRRYVRALVSSVTLGRDGVLIAGPKDAVAACASDPDRLGTVLTFDRRWCALGESNPSCKNENLES